MKVKHAGLAGTLTGLAILSFLLTIPAPAAAFPDQSAADMFKAKCVEGAGFNLYEVSTVCKAVYDAIRQNNSKLRSDCVTACNALPDSAEFKAVCVNDCSKLLPY
jgi:hypothetical protein